jgi:hypothetical protein
MKTFEWFKAVCEFVEGCTDEPPPGLEKVSAAWVRGLWWGLLLLIILLFSGQTSKFIYVDF